MSSSHTPLAPTRRRFLAALAASPAALAVPAFSFSATPSVAASGETRGAVARRMVGDIEVLALADGFASFPNGYVNGYEPAAAREAAQAAYLPFDQANITVAINGYVIRSGGRVIAVDTGAPAAMAETSGRWSSSLAEAGVARDEVDTLFLTHMHADHVGGMTHPDGERILPNAELMLAETEWQFTYDDAVLAQIPENFQNFVLFARGQAAPYAEGRRMLAMSEETEVAPGVTAVPLPGHTPGHMGLRVASGPESLLIWGDVVHAAAYQFAQPDWSMVFDADEDLARRTRKRMLDQAAADRTLVAGMHLDFPAAGYVERSGGSYRYISAPPDYRA